MTVDNIQKSILSETNIFLFYSKYTRMTYFLTNIMIFFFYNDLKWGGFFFFIVYIKQLLSSFVYNLWCVLWYMHFVFIFFIIRSVIFTSYLVISLTTFGTCFLNKNVTLYLMWFRLTTINYETNNSTILFFFFLYV